MGRGGVVTEGQVDLEALQRRGFRFASRSSSTNRCMSMILRMRSSGVRRRFSIKSETSTSRLYTSMMGSGGRGRRGRSVTEGKFSRADGRGTGWINRARPRRASPAQIPEKRRIPWRLGKQRVRVTCAQEALAREFARPRSQRSLPLGERPCALTALTPKPRLAPGHADRYRAKARTREAGLHSSPVAHQSRYPRISVPDSPRALYGGPSRRRPAAGLAPARAPQCSRAPKVLWQGSATARYRPGALLVCGLAHRRFAHRRRCVPERLANVLCLQIRKVAKDLVLGHAVRQHRDHGSHGYAQTTNTGNATHLAGIDCDAWEGGHWGRSLRSLAPRDVARSLLLPDAAMVRASGTLGLRGMASKYLNSLVSPTIDACFASRFLHPKPGANPA